MSINVVYAIRGFVAFVAFIEFVNATRALTSGLLTEPEDLLKISFLQNKIFTEVTFTNQTEAVASQLFGVYSFLNCCILISSAVLIHYKALNVLAIICLLLKLVFYLTQGFLYKTIQLNASFQVPVLFTLCGLIGLIISTYSLQSHNTRYSSTSSENDELLKQMKFPKSRKSKNI